MSATGSRGTSLIELLVALAIVAVLVASVRLVFPDTGARRAEDDSERLQALLQLACERAELSGLAMGVGLARDRVAFGPLRTGRWSPLPRTSADVLRERTFEPGLELGLQVDGVVGYLPVALPRQPQLACSGSGELSRFRLDFRGPSGASWHLRHGEDGRIERQRNDGDG
jgi:prepilin-type N-terminal cleavage/methylation domain-containing protein